VAQLDAKILANAHAAGDVDGDGATELLFGSLMGKVSVFKVRCEAAIACSYYSMADEAAAGCGGPPGAVEELRGERVRDVHLPGRLVG
jgi:hypothetical protein